MSNGTVVLPSCKNFSSAPRAFINSCGGGGTNEALVSVLPAAPIQFWDVRNSPGVFSPPRTLCMSSP